MQEKNTKIIYRKNLTHILNDDWEKKILIPIFFFFVGSLLLSFVTMNFFNFYKLLFYKLAITLGLIPAKAIVVFMGLLMLYTLKYIITTEKFILDLNNKTIYYEEGFWFNKTRKTVGPFNGVEMVAISTAFRISGYGPSFASTMVMYLFDGVEIKLKQYSWPFCNFPGIKVPFDEDVNKEGKNIAQIIGCDFFPGAGGHKVVRDYHIDHGVKYSLKNLAVIPVNVLKDVLKEKEKQHI